MEITSGRSANKKTLCVCVCNLSTLVWNQSQTLLKKCKVCNNKAVLLQQRGSGSIARYDNYRGAAKFLVSFSPEESKASVSGPWPHTGRATFSKCDL